MEGHSYGIQWIQHCSSPQLVGSVKSTTQIMLEAQPPRDEEIMAIEDAEDVADYLVDEQDAVVSSQGTTVVLPVSEADELDQIAAENLIFMARDGQMVSEIISTTPQGTVVVTASDGTQLDCEAVLQHVVGLSTDDNGECHIVEAQPNDHCYTIDADNLDYEDTTPQMVTEEVITDDWVQHQGEERVEIAAEQIIGSSSQVLLDMEVPLPTVQDEYTSLRPYPCDFCSRRFRKKASLMNHMVAHQNDRPHLCKLCGDRFFRRSDLINHLKAHAEAPEEPEYSDGIILEYSPSQHHQIHSPLQQQHLPNSQQNHHNYQHTETPADHYYEQHWQEPVMQQQQQSEQFSSQHAVHMPMHTQQISSKARKTAKSRSASNNQNTSGIASHSPLHAEQIILHNVKPSSHRGRISRLKPKEENYTIDESLGYEVVECQELQASTAAVKIIQDPPSSAHQKHYPIIDDIKPFVCQQCGLAFAREKALLSHTKNHRNDSPFECNECNEIFWDSSSLQEHQKSHQFEESNSEYDPAEADDTQSESESEQTYGEFYCSECGVSFHRQDLLRRHAKTHEKRANGELISTGGVSFEHNSDRHCCNTCGETFAEALDLLAHAEIHARYPPFKCVLCGESFFEELTIKRHLQSQHVHEMTANSCILCGKECRDRKALIKHAWDHSREKCHSCSKCGKNFHNKARLKRHMASHRDKSVICDVCHEEFPDGRTLSNHRHSHSTTSSGKLFPCNECGKTFGSRSSQQIHVRIHTGERPYGCRFCWKAFADGGTLRKHERIHTGEKPYACSVCPRAFNQRVVLREHIRSHHSGLDAKRGTYHCTVCTADLLSSNELIQHLIQHSDKNTAMQRQPVSGPRKYKRRRKLKPHEIARMRKDAQYEGQGSDIDLSDFDMENVDDLLGISEEQPSVVADAKSVLPAAKPTKTARIKVEQNIIKNSSARTAAAEAEEEELDVVSSKAKPSEVKLWQTKLLQTRSQEDSYKTIMSNLENTLQSIDTLVVGEQPLPESTAQRTQQVQISKAEGKAEVSSSSRSRAAKRNSNETPAKQSKAASSLRPRMIHTQKAKPQETGSKRRANKTLVTRIEQELPAACTTSTVTGLDLLAQHSIRSNASMVDDFEIICPNNQPPKQISCSPLHIKQEQDASKLQQRQQQHSSELYDAQLLLEASTLRKQVYEKFNPSIVQDLEEILRSPLKCDKSGARAASGSCTERQRFTSESSTIHFEVEEQNSIKIEPTSPDLTEIVSGSLNANRSSAATTQPRSSNRSRTIANNRKYLQFESSGGLQKSGQKRAQNAASHSQQKPKNARTAGKREAATKAKSNSKTLAAANNNIASNSVAYLDYNVVDAFGSSRNSTSNELNAALHPYHTAATIAASSSSNVAPAQPIVERKKRYFECEMCSAVFSDRAQLLDHVPIHI